MDDDKTIVVEGQSVAYLKLMKNTKGYNWEIKVLSLNIEELKALNDRLMAEYGSVA